MRPATWKCLGLGGAVLGVLVLCALGGRSDDPPKAGPPKKPAAGKGESTVRVKARLAVAQRGFDESMEIYRQTQRSGQVITPWVNADQVYAWSKRCLSLDEALAGKPSDRVSAFEAHLKRMQRLEKTARVLRDAELVTRVEPLAAEFYRLEAEGWLADEKAK